MFSVTEQVLQVEFLPYATEQKLRRTIVYDVENGAQLRTPTPHPTCFRKKTIHWCGVDRNEIQHINHKFLSFVAVLQFCDLPFPSRPCLAFPQPPPSPPLPIKIKKGGRERERGQLIQKRGYCKSPASLNSVNFGLRHKVTHLWPTILLAYSLNTALLPLL